MLKKSPINYKTYQRELNLLKNHCLKQPLFPSTWNQKNIKSLPLLKKCSLFWKIKQLQKGRPLAYILKESEFLGEKFLVTPHTLIPRFETEEITHNLIEKIEKNWNPKKKPISILEIGTGCGVITISLAKKIPYARLTTVEISPQALNIARKNARKLLGPMHQIKFIRNDIFQINDFSQKFDLIVSNPPYVETNLENSQLDPRVKLFEPSVALFAGPDGLDFFEKIAPRLPKWLRPKGSFCFEIGNNQEKSLLKLFSAHFYPPNLRFQLDLQGKKRSLWYHPHCNK